MKQGPVYLGSPKLRQVRIADMANPTSAPALAHMVSSNKRRRQDRRPSELQLNKLNSSSCGRTNAKTAVTKYMADTSLWMNRLPETPSSDDEDELYIAEKYQNQNLNLAEAGRDSQACRLDLQTNNSKREQHVSLESHKKAPSNKLSPESSEYDFASDISESSIPISTHAVAKGADAMVKNSLSRQTEIIDTSKLVEEGKVETEYDEAPEVIEEQDRTMIDDYEKTFAYARRLRALLNMDFKELDKGTIETNFLLVKAHEHPTQKMTERWRRVDLGESYNDQVKRQKLIDDYRANAVKKKGKSGKDDSVPHYPDMLRFTVRFRKDNSEKRWKDYLAFRQKQKKSGGRKDNAPVPKPNDKYVFAYQDIWSFCVVVFVRPWANIREIVDPVFARLGLERRADFTYTIGTFNNDKRAGKAKILGVPNSAEQLEMYTIASELYKKNCTEIYVNDNRCEMFLVFPDYYNRNVPVKPGEAKDKGDADKDKEGKGKKGKKGDKDAKDAKGAKDAKDAKGDKESKAATGKSDNKNKSNAVANTSSASSANDESGSSDSLLSESARSAQATPATGDEAQTQSEIRGSAFLGDEAAAFEESAAMSSNCRLSPSQQQQQQQQQQLSLGRKLTLSDDEYSSSSE